MPKYIIAKNFAQNFTKKIKEEKPMNKLESAETILPPEPEEDFLATPEDNVKVTKTVSAVLRQKGSKYYTTSGGLEEITDALKLLRHDLTDLATCNIENAAFLQEELSHLQTDLRLKYSTIGEGLSSANKHLIAHDNQINLLASQTNDALNTLSDDISAIETNTTETTESLTSQLAYIQTEYKKLSTQLKIQFILIMAIFIELIVTFWILH